MKLPVVLRNTDIRLVSLLLAVLLWFHAVTERTYRVAVRCPVTVRNIPSGWMLTNRGVGANCLITATGKEIIAMRIAPPSITVDAANRQIKRMTVDLDRAAVRYPYGIVPRSVEFTPGQLAIAFDREEARQVRVVADIRGLPADGFLVADSVTVSPAAVEVRGPQRLLETLDSVYTQPLPVDGQAEPLERWLRLALPDTVFSATSPETVLVRVPFEKAGERLFRNVPIRLANRGTGYLVSFSPGTVDVVVAGPQPALAAAGAADVIAVIDLRGLERGRYRLQATIELPERLELLTASPRDFDVNIR